MRPIPTFLFAAATLSAAAFAAEPPAYTVGEVFVFDDGRVERVHDVKGDKVTWATRGGRTYERSVNPVTPILEWSYRGQVGERSIVGTPDNLFPLKPGATVRFSTVTVVQPEDEKEGRGRARRSLQLYTCWVDAMETTQTPAGDFETFPLVCDRHSPNSMRTLERTTWNFAPDVGHYVRRERRTLRDGKAETFSLYATVPPREANATRISALARAAREAETPREMADQAE